MSVNPNVTALEAATERLHTHLGSCTACEEDRACDEVHVLVDAVAAFSICPKCRNVITDHTSAERVACGITGNLR